MCFCILFARFNVLELRGEGRIISGLAETLPSHAFTSGFSVNNKIVIVFMSYTCPGSPLSLAVQPAGALRGAEGELGWAEVGVRALAVVLPLHADAPGPPDGVTRGGAEALTQVAARGKQALQVTQAENRKCKS